MRPNAGHACKGVNACMHAFSAMHACARHERMLVCDRTCIVHAYVTAMHASTCGACLHACMRHVLAASALIAQPVLAHADEPAFGEGLRQDQHAQQIRLRQRRQVLEHSQAGPSAVIERSDA